MREEEIGILGMGVMGKSLALNCAGKNINVAVYNRYVEGKEEKIASQFAASHSDLKGYDDLEEFIKALKPPRVILLMIKAGLAVDAVIDQLMPYLEHGDVLADGGNSYFKDTEARIKKLKSHDIYYIGMGISGGEEGALNGPSLMPGGSERGYILAQQIFSKMAARDKYGKPCIEYLGSGGAGHYVKMVHNGIEYAEMQLLAEVYQLLKKHYALNTSEIADFFSSCRESGLDSFLLEITVDILNFKENGELIIDKVLDQSEQKGTGRWTVESALELGAAIDPVSEAVMARYISAEKDLREKLSKHYNFSYPIRSFDENAKQMIKSGLQAARIINHLSAFDLLSKASKEYQWDLELDQVARIWTNGCIIRSELMEKLVEVYAEDRLGWSHSSIKEELNAGIAHLKAMNIEAFNSYASVPVLSASLNLFNALTTADSSANLIQAQRDYFGAHTYQRKDKSGYFHSDWKS